MATTKNFSIGPLAWTHVGAGRADGSMVRIESFAPCRIAITVGSRLIPPEIPVLSGHRSDGRIDLPIVAMQQIWACAPASGTLVVTV